jgi:hypothetical protein
MAGYGRQLAKESVTVEMAEMRVGILNLVVDCGGVWLAVEK